MGIVTRELRLYNSQGSVAVRPLRASRTATAVTCHGAGNPKSFWVSSVSRSEVSYLPAGAPDASPIPPYPHESPKTHQYGPYLSRRTPIYWSQVTRGEWGAAVQNLNHFGDAYPTRRQAEGRLIQGDITGGQLPLTEASCT